MFLPNTINATATALEYDPTTGTCTETPVPMPGWEVKENMLVPLLLEEDEDLTYIVQAGTLAFLPGRPDSGWMPYEMAILQARCDAELQYEMDQ